MSLKFMAGWQVFDQALAGGGAKSINFQELAADLASVTFEYPFRIPPCKLSYLLLDVILLLTDCIGFTRCISALISRKMCDEQACQLSVASS